MNLTLRRKEARYQAREDYEYQVEMQRLRAHNLMDEAADEILRLLDDVKQLRAERDRIAADLIEIDRLVREYFEAKGKM